MKLLKGKKIAEAILKKIKAEIKKSSLQPTLAVILIGSDKASDLYVSLKKKAAQKIGIRFRLLRFSKEVREKAILDKIKELNADKEISGIIVQLPLPESLNTQKIIDALDPHKDVDGFHPENIRSFLKKQGRFFPVFPQAIMEILISSRVKLREKRASIIANSKIFGEIMAAALGGEGIRAGYFLFKDLKHNSAALKKAEIVISAVGRPGFLKGEMMQEGVFIIDGGIAKKGKIVLGDVDYASVKRVAYFLTPVPGGVGPVTIACLLRNTFLAAKILSKRR